MCLFDKERRQRDERAEFLPVAILMWGKHSCLPFQIAIAEPAANWMNKEVLVVRPTFVVGSV
jgi:hypothetical protein